MESIELRPYFKLRRDYNNLLELFTTAFYRAFVKLNDNVVDAGANRGLHTLPLADSVGINGKVFAFEPNPTLVDRLINLNKDQIIIYKKALFNKSDFREYLMYKCDGINHLRHNGYMHPLCKDEDKIDTIIVELCTMDQLLIEHEISFIKMDIEGSEFFALKGAENIILKSKPIIIFENSLQMAGSQYEYSEEEYFKWFSDMGYVIYDIHGVLINKWSENYSWQCISLHKNDKRLDEIMSFIDHFWEVAINIPIFLEHEIDHIIKAYF